MIEHTSHNAITLGDTKYYIVPEEDYIKAFPNNPERRRDLVPSEVAELIIKKGLTHIHAWREHLGLTQEWMARRMGITQPAYSQIESSKRPHKSTKAKAAAAMEIYPEQLG